MGHRPAASELRPALNSRYGPAACKAHPDDLEIKQLEASNPLEVINPKLITPGYLVSTA